MSHLEFHAHGARPAGEPRHRRRPLDGRRRVRLEQPLDRRLGWRRRRRGSSSAKPTSGGTLVVGIPTETPGWNPASDEWDDTGNLVGSTVLEPLATAGADAGAKPWLATSWIANKDFTKWVVKLRPGVQFQDGTPFNAQAVVANFDAYLASPFYTLTLGAHLQGHQGARQHDRRDRFQAAVRGVPAARISTARPPT